MKGFFLLRRAALVNVLYLTSGNSKDKRCPKGGFADEYGGLAESFLCRDPFQSILVQIKSIVS